MTQLLLLRHGTTAAVGQRLVGRLPGIELSARGATETRALGARLARQPITAVYSSPLERAVATACAVAEPHGVPVQSRPDLTDVDFGEWTGLGFGELDTIAAWQAFNSRRSLTRPPGGEHVLEVQLRMVRELQRIVLGHPAGTVAVVSHADPLRAAIAYHLGMPLDFILRLEIAPASLSVLSLSPDGAGLLSLNDTAHLSG
jgi:broad specificity phosphatase PhoE